MKRTWLLRAAIGCAAFVGLLPSVCAAAPSPSTPASDSRVATLPKQPNTRRWYGWQTLTADGVAGTLYVVAIAADYNPKLLAASGITYGLGAPAIHSWHGNRWLSLASMGVRVVTPVVGLVIGLSADERVENDSNGKEHSNKWTLIGVGIGGLVAAATDALVFAYDTHPPTPKPARNQLIKLDPLPQLLVSRNSAGLGLSGQF